MQYRVEAKIRVGVRGVDLYSHHCNLAACELQLARGEIAVVRIASFVRRETG